MYVGLSDRVSTNCSINMFFFLWKVIVILSEYSDLRYNLLLSNGFLKIILVSPVAFFLLLLTLGNAGLPHVCNIAFLLLGIHAAF